MREIPLLVLFFIEALMLSSPPLLGVEPVIHGFSVKKYESTQSWQDLVKTRGLTLESIGEGGPFQCLVDSAEQYAQWRVVFYPLEKEFFVIDEKSANGQCYGPIPGDAIESLKLLHQQSDLRGFKEDVQHQRRTSNLVRARIKKLLSARDKLLLRHGLIAVCRLGDLEQHEVPAWSDSIDAAIGQRNSRVHLQRESRRASDYITSQMQRIDAERVEIALDKYSKGRAPTQAELALPWGRPIEGLSLAVMPWTENTRQLTVGETCEVRYLVRNVSEVPRKIATLEGHSGVIAELANLSSGHRVRMQFPGGLGMSRTIRVRLLPGEIVEIKRFQFIVREGGMLPPGKIFDPKNIRSLYGHLCVQPRQKYQLVFQLRLPAAYSQRDGKITLPAKGEFAGRLTTEFEVTAAGTAEDRNDQGLGRVRFVKRRLVEAETGLPIADAKIAAGGAAPGSAAKNILVHSDRDGIFQVPVRKGQPVSFVPLGYFVRQFVAFDQDKVEGGDQVRDVRVWKGRAIGGRLLLPNGKPAAGVRLNVGAYFHNQEWKKRMGLPLGFHSWDRGDWPNWTCVVQTDIDGMFYVTVPPDEAISWFRLGTTSLSFAADTLGNTTQLKQCQMFETPRYYRDIIPTLPLPKLLDDDSITNLGTLKLKRGTVLKGRVLDPVGKPLHQVHLFTAAGHGPHAGRHAVSNRNGEFEMWAVPPGEVRLTVDARLRDEAGKVISRDVQATFIDRSFHVPDQDKPFEFTVMAGECYELTFQLIDRRSQPEERIAYYGTFSVSGMTNGQRWRGRLSHRQAEGRRTLSVSVPKQLQGLKLHLTSDQVSTAGYQDEQGKSQGPGAIQLQRPREKVRRTIVLTDPVRN